MMFVYPLQTTPFMIVPGFRFAKPVPNAIIGTIAKANLQHIILKGHTEGDCQTVTEQTPIIR